ncbi:hypothetical protein TRFO_21901 [Tritrichomonas foetus]|uniref:Uncharacterized protein n=1 Tax=Tritrichomonas foetus TaxID=1144522 RepID=A0A1J4KIV7_9EUKA|nr:hypothetical protein TRFO_21901 [Tritrichomonas foetus]|eukprot:OHT09253.1 hypothetical protein TRFO_21901 [Tritrichomonas foetus]
MEEDAPVRWEFTDIFKSNDTRIACVIDVLEAFENFPPDTRLNCDDYYSLLSTICDNIPYQFIVFVCECVDPSISSGTLMSHRIAFGNFLLAFPCCILFPQFIQKLLTLFKTADRLRVGVISRSNFISILKETFSSFLQTVTLATKNKVKEEEEEEEEDDDEPRQEQITSIDPRRLPDFSMIHEVQRATTNLDELSVQTLLFVMWQKDPTLLRCKTRIKPENLAIMQQAEREQHYNQNNENEDDENIALPFQPSQQNYQVNNEQPNNYSNNEQNEDQRNKREQNSDRDHSSEQQGNRFPEIDSQSTLNTFDNDDKEKQSDILNEAPPLARRGGYEDDAPPMARRGATDYNSDDADDESDDDNEDENDD